jgi:tRNA pseudouridine55 synthase
VEAEMSALIGDLMQTPPMVSAVKKDGVPLYNLARKGKTVERNPKLIHIYEFNLRDFSPPLVSFVLRCTKGTYVRTLCSDIGEKLGCFAHLAELRRTRAGRMNVENAVPFNRVLEMTQDELLPYIIPLHKIGVTT